MIETPFTMVKMNFDKDETGKHGAFTNVFSCWNGMVGCEVIAYQRDRGQITGLVNVSHSAN